MKKRRLGKSGFEVSEIGLGCWQLGGDFGPVSDARAGEILGAARAAGVEFWDTADVYGGGLSESRIGKAIAAGPGVVVATKVGRDAALFPDGYTRDKVRASLQRSAGRLGVETIDLAQLHCVPRDVLEAGDILDWMAGFQDDGLIRHFGASVETVDEAMLAIRHPRLATLQIIFNLFRQNPIDALFPAAGAADVGIIVRLPLASGVLGGNMTRNQVFDAGDHRQYNRHGEAFSQGETFSGIPFELAVELVDELKAWCPPGMSMAQMAMRWILDHAAVSTVIAGASRPEQVLANAATSGLAPLSDALHGRLGAFFRERVRDRIVVPV